MAPEVESLGGDGRRPGWKRESSQGRSTQASTVSQSLLFRGCSHLTSRQSGACAPVLPAEQSAGLPALRPAPPLPLEPLGNVFFSMRVGIWEGKESKFHFLDYKFVFLNIVSLL